MIPCFSFFPSPTSCSFAIESTSCSFPEFLQQIDWSFSACVGPTIGVYTNKTAYSLFFVQKRKKLMECCPFYKFVVWRRKQKKKEIKLELAIAWYTWLMGIGIYRCAWLLNALVGACLLFRTDHQHVARVQFSRRRAVGYHKLNMQFPCVISMMQEGLRAADE